jgi:hypothetical protein
VVRAIRLAVGALILGGCVAPILTVSDLTKAETELEAAKAAGAQQWAPYEYTSAATYLHRARELFGSSGPHYQDAYEDAQKAYRLAKTAREKAADHPRD